MLSPKNTNLEKVIKMNKIMQIIFYNNNYHNFNNKIYRKNYNNKIKFKYLKNNQKISQF